MMTTGPEGDMRGPVTGSGGNPGVPEVAERLQEAGMKVVSIGGLRERGGLLTGEPQPIEFTERVVAVVRKRDGAVIDVVHQVKG
ncbi:citrate lyase subunit alpha [Escherichia coli]|uniref:citrate lyase subunit alpha n=1 Tax=Escherichia coli TaxID=562 RepID=UPI002452A22E|nr:citrate lyase subunit alpha [Escherichia coli]